MKGIVLAGGKGTRLEALTRAGINKHCLPVGRYPMLYHPLHTLKNGGIKDVMVITGKEHMGSIIDMLGSGSNFGMSFTYRIQDKADGIAGALKLCEDFVKSDGSNYFVTILGDNIYEDDLSFEGIDISDNFVYSSRDETKNKKIPVCKLFLKKVKDPNRFGVVELKNEYGNKVVRIVEKPKNFISNLAVTGCYVYDSYVWDILKNLEVSDRNEFEITDVNNWYVENGIVSYKYLKNDWTDAGTHESLIKANNQCKDVKYQDFI